MTDKAYQPKKNLKWRLSKLSFKFGWHKFKHDNLITGRIHHLLLNHHRWYDWGHKVMILVGTCEGGSYGYPQPQTWWYKQGAPKRMRRTKYPIHPLSTYIVIKDYEQFRDQTAGNTEDEMYKWQAIYITQDGELGLGHRYWGGNFYELSKADSALLRKYLRYWRRLDWYGLRTWLYSQALHAAVNQKKPFACNQTPPKGSGGYDHWYCQLPKRHKEMHRVNSYVWGKVGGIDIGHVVYVPEERGASEKFPNEFANRNSED